MAVITISKEYASDSETFAGKLADKLHYSLLDKQLVLEAAKELNLPQSETTGLVTSRKSGIMRFIDEHTATTVQQVIDRTYGRLESRAYYEVTSKLISQATQDDNVIIVGWGGQCILKDHIRAIHLRIVKDIEDRIAWLKKNLMIDEHAAKNLIELEEGESSSYIRHYFNREWNDVHLYHLVLNLSKIPMDEAIDLTVAFVKQHKTP